MLDNVVAPTAVLLIVVVATAYLVGTSIAQNHVVAPQGVDMVSELGAHDLLASFGAGEVFGQATPLATTSTAAIRASISSAVLLILFPPSCDRDLSIPQPPLSHGHSMHLRPHRRANPQEGLIVHPESWFSETWCASYRIQGAQCIGRSAYLAHRHIRTGPKKQDRSTGALGQTSHADTVMRAAIKRASILRFIVSTPYTLH
jgi:hypothetical protein